MYWLRLFFVVFREIHNFNYDYVRHVTEIYLSTKLMFVGAAVSEIRESNRNKKEKNNLQNGYLRYLYILTSSMNLVSQCCSSEVVC